VIRYSISSEFLDVTFTARSAFSERSWKFVQAIVFPWLMCAGQRCISRMAALGDHKRSLSGYYRFLSDGKWRLEVLFRCLFKLIVETFVLSELTLVLDDTLCPKWGKGIFGTGSFFDHARRPRPGYIWGHNWIVLAIVVQVGAVGWVALPFWIGLYRSEKTCRAGEFRTRHQIAVEALEAVRCWFSDGIVLLADGAYNNQSLVRPAQRLGISVVSRLRSDARLREPTPRRQPKGKRGRKPKRGAYLSKLKTLARGGRAFRTEQVRIYGKTVEMRLREIVAYWPPLDCVVKVVIARDPKRRHRVAYLMSTDVSMTAVQIVELFARRWTIEQLFSVTKNQLGLDSAEVRKERSVIRHAAFCMAMATWIEVWAHRSCPRVREKSFANKIATLRSESMAETIFASGPRTKGSREIASSIGSLVATVAAAS